MYANCHHNIIGEEDKTYEEEELFLEMFDWISRGMLPLSKVIDTIEIFISRISDPDIAFYFLDHLDNGVVYINYVAKLALQRWLSLVDVSKPEVQEQLKDIVVRGLKKEIATTRASIMAE
jgi:hypothetical protein